VLMGHAYVRSVVWRGQEGTDFYIEFKDSCISRISFVIIAIPGKAMGSIAGIKTLSRQRDLPQSTVDERKFLYFLWGERAVLEFCEGRRFALWPKNCIVFGRTPWQLYV
jgi:hypothetical protein